jgi:hypothetical protein
MCTDANEEIKSQISDISDLDNDDSINHQLIPEIVNEANDYLFEVKEEFESNNATDDEYIPPTKVPRITRETVRRLDINSAEDISDISSIDTHEDKLPIKRKNPGMVKEAKKPKFSNNVLDSLKEVQCYKCSNMITMCKIIDHFTKEHPRFQKLKNTYYGDKKPYMCGLCNASLSHEISQKEHLCFSILPTKTVRGKIEVYICETCGLEFKSSSSYISHITSVHEPEKAFNCSQCKYIAGTGVLLYSHVQRRHNATKMKPEGHYKWAKPHKCDYCDHEGFFYLRDKRKHIRITHPKQHVSQ